MDLPSARHDVFQAIADPTRRKLLTLLANKEMSIVEMNGYFSMSRTAVSKHLRILKDAGLVRDQKVGRETRYSLQPEPLLEIQRWLSYYERFWESKLALLKNYVETEGGE